MDGKCCVLEDDHILSFLCLHVLHTLTLLVHFQTVPIWQVHIRNLLSSNIRNNQLACEIVILLIVQNSGPQVPDCIMSMSAPYAWRISHCYQRMQG